MKQFSYPLPLWMEEVGIAPNTSVARRWIVEGRVFVNHERVTDIAHEICGPRCLPSVEVSPRVQDAEGRP